jgi:hypothetical protein
MVFVPKVFVLLAEAQREAESQFPFDRSEVGGDRQKSNPTDRPVSAYSGAAPFVDRDVSEIRGRHLVGMSVELERRVLEFRPEMNRESDTPALDLEQVPFVAVSNPTGYRARRPWNYEPFVVGGPDVIDSFGGPDFPLSSDSNLRDDDHELRNLRETYIPSVSSAASVQRLRSPEAAESRSTQGLRHAYIGRCSFFL